MSESTNERRIQVLEELGIRLPYPLPAECAGVVESFTYSQHPQIEMLHFSRPHPPGHEVWVDHEWGDGLRYDRDCTPEEIAEREESYKKALAKWEATQGMAIVHTGPTVDHAKVTMADGRYYVLVGDGERWGIVMSRTPLTTVKGRPI